MLVKKPNKQRISSWMDGSDVKVVKVTQISMSDLLQTNIDLSSIRYHILATCTSLFDCTCYYTHGLSDITQNNKVENQNRDDI